MKKILLTVTIIIGISIACKKKKDTVDTTSPVIVLNGSSNDTVSLNAAFVEKGATAADDKDGEITSSIAISGSVNKDLVGDYKMYYNVKDAAGNSATQVTRNIYVKNDANYLVGFYNAIPNCGATATSSFVTQVKVSTTINNRIEFSVGSYFTATNPTIEVTTNKINIPYYNSGTNSSYSANGTISSDKKSFVLSYSVTNPNWTWNCTTNYIKQ